MIVAKITSVIHNIVHGSMHGVCCYKRFWYLVPLLLVNTNIFAQSEEIAVKLKKIESIHTQEKYGDELYISVTEFPAKEDQPRHYQVPAFPTHWLSRYLQNMHDVVIWKKSVDQCEPVDLLISLVETDVIPWNVDDLLGSIELKVKCVNGKAVDEWSIPNPKITTKIANEKNAFSFTGEKAEYRAVFNLDKKNIEKGSQTQPVKEKRDEEEGRFNIMPSN